MRIPNPFRARAEHGPSFLPDDTVGITIDVMTGIVAGVALVLALLILAASLHPAQAGSSAPAPIAATVRIAR